MADRVWEVLEFQGRSLVWLAKESGYSASHVHAFKNGRFHTPAKFRAACARLLGIPEALLFQSGAPTSSDVSAGTPDSGSDGRASTAVVTRA